MDWSDLAPDTDMLRVPVNAVMNFKVSQKLGKFLD